MVAVVPAVVCFASVFLAVMASPSVPGGGGAGSEEILEYNFTRDKNGGYFYRFKTSNGIERQETGEIVKDNNKESVILQVVGYYKFLRENGEVEEVKYRADKNGFVVIPSEQHHQQFRLQKLAIEKQQEQQLHQEIPADGNEPDDEVGTRIKTCVIASLCGTASG